MKIEKQSLSLLVLTQKKTYVANLSNEFKITFFSTKYQV